MNEKRIAEALAFGDGARDAAGFKTEPEVILIFVPGAVVIETHGDEAQRKCDEHDRHGRFPEMFFLRRV